MPTAPPRHNARKVTQARAITQRQYNKTKRVNQTFYDSKEWRGLRAWYVKVNPLCVVCLKNGFVKPVQVVDHIKEISDGGQPLDNSNLQSLCHAHHNIKTAAVKVLRNMKQLKK